MKKLCGTKTGSEHFISHPSWIFLFFVFIVAKFLIIKNIKKWCSLLFFYISLGSIQPVAIFINMMDTRQTLLLNILISIFLNAHFALTNILLKFGVQFANDENMLNAHFIMIHDIIFEIIQNYDKTVRGR